jgi:hypothetical protein
MVTIRATLSLAVAAIAISIGARPVIAQSDSTRNHLYDKFQINLSGTDVLLSSTIRVDGAKGNGTELSTEGDLGLARSKLQPRLSLRWRPGHRHELELGYQFARRSGEKVLSKDITFGDSTYQAGLTVRPTFNSDQGFLIYRFAFTAKPRTQIGAALGIGPYFFKMGLDALASISSDSQSRSVEFSQTRSLVGPTASLGLYGRFRVGDRWYVDGDIRGVKVSVDRFTATVFDASATGRYFVSRVVGLEAGYGIDAIKVDVGPKTSGPTAGLVSGMIKFSQQNFRLGLVVVP